VNVYGMVAIGAALVLLYNNGGSLMNAAVSNTDSFYQYDAAFKRESARTGVPWRWLKAIAMNESSLGANPLVAAGLVSTDGLSYGLMQVTVKTASWLKGSAVTSDDLNDPDFSIAVAADYLAYLSRRFPGNREYIVRGYNGGPGFLGTKRGISETPIYYDRFQRNLATVLEKQPGNELET
jgi:soluble lytic murein transglycosylase-like protein